MSVYIFPAIHAAGPTPGGYYYLNPVPGSTQEGNTVSLVLTATGATGSTLYQFRFLVKNPANVTFQSRLQNYTTLPGQSQFSILLVYPSASIPGSTALLGQYAASVDLVSPVTFANAASSSFFINIVDSSEHERTQTVGIQASGYAGAESVTVTIRTQTTATIVLSQVILASPAGIVIASWKIPRNATIDTYVATVSGTNTVKSPPDTQHFLVNPATMSVATIVLLKPIYQRTDVMQFSFQPTYPDGSFPSTGVGLLTLARPSGSKIILTAVYNNYTQTFNANYPTTATNETGIWTATLTARAYGDGYGNTGPATNILNTPQLSPAVLAVNVTATSTNIAVGQQLRFNATIMYPDYTFLQSGTVKAYLLNSGTPAINDSVPMVFDTTLGLWVGSYTVRSADPGGLWSLVVKASDSSTPANAGTATRAINIQNNPPASFPLYYFGIIAAIIAGLLIAFFLVFKRRRVTHARLKIDLEAVHSEAGRIESSDFFKSVKDQVRKEKEE